MPDLKINGLPAHVSEGDTVLDAAELVFVEIPTLCHLKQCEPETACMLCVVKNIQTGELIPACSARAEEGMEIDTECEAVQTARRDILELLLSEHVGDCEAPCTRICPAHLDIPLMLRRIEQGNLEEAAWIARRDLAIPAILSHVCPAPCEKGCRRGQIDTSITIRALHEGSVLGFKDNEFVRELSHVTNHEQPPKRAAVIGSGPAGLGCAWELRQLGIACTVFDEALHAGGPLRKNPDLPANVLESEIESLWQAGIEFRLGESISLHELAEGYDGVVFASPEWSGAHFTDAIHAEEHKLAVKAVANGKAAARRIALKLEQELKNDIPDFDSKTGRLRESELQEFLKNCPARSADAAPDDPASEAARCLHCDCRRPVSCRLRRYADQYGAEQQRYPADERAHVQLIGHHEAVVFEPGKCIKCGLCVQLTKRAGEELGLTFVGRGFNTRVSVPFGRTLEAGLRRAAGEVVAACPTGALAFTAAEEKQIGRGSPR